jgi:carboxymethylenebutenolidase
MDGFGIRPVMWEMSQRMADGGYLVLLPDLYYRTEDSPPTPDQVRADPRQRERLMTLVGSLDRGRKVSDARAFIDFLSSRSDVSGDRFGAVGYCMGGNIALTVGGAFPGRFAAIASFHGSQLASQQPDSPHRFAANITGRVYVAGASEDASFPEEQKERLEEALTRAGVEHLIETYPARHGFAVPDHPAFDPVAAERHWTALFRLLGETLGGAA